MLQVLVSRRQLKFASQNHFGRRFTTPQYPPHHNLRSRICDGGLATFPKIESFLINF